VLSAARPWIVWGLSALFVVYNYLQQVVPGIVAPDLVREFHVGAGELGTIAALFFYAYAILQIPVGLTLDRFGPRRPLAMAVCVAALGSLLFSVSSGAGTAGLGRLVIGAGAAFSFIASLKLASNWFAPERFATLAGLTNTAGMIGAAAGDAPLAFVVARLGWRGSLGLLGGAGAVLAVLILLFVRDRPLATANAAPPHDATPSRPRTGTAEGWPEGEVSIERTAGSTMEIRSDRTPEPATEIDTVTHGLRLIIAKRQAWVNALYATAISVVFVAFGALWGTAYIEKAYGVSKFTAAAAASLLFLGAIPGSIFFGWYSDRIRRRKAPMLAAAGGGLACICALLYLPGLPLVGLRVLLGALGFCCSANIVSYAVSHDISPPGRDGLALGFLNTCFYAGSAVSQPIVGRLLDLRSTARGAAGFESLTAGDYRFALSGVAGALALALIAAGLLRESHPRARC